MKARLLNSEQGLIRFNSEQGLTLTVLCCTLIKRLYVKKYYRAENAALILG